MAKAITESVAAEGGAKAAASTSIVGYSAMQRALSPRQAYEQDAIVRTAIIATAEQLAQCARRVFSRATGEELVDGDAYQFVRAAITPSFIRAITSWWLVEGERAALKLFEVGKARPSKLIPLDPGYLLPTPPQARSLDYVTSWTYQDGLAVNGVKAALVIDAADLMFAKNWNPHNPVRGLSPLVSCAIEATTNYSINRLNAAFFQNGGQRGLIINFPKGTKEEVVKQWVREYEARHGIWQGNAFKISATIGEEIQISEPGDNAKDGQFLELRRANSDVEAGVLGVPASVMGFYDRSRFDTVDAEESIWFQYRLLPLAADTSEWLQKTLIDPHFAGGSVGAKKLRPKFLSRSMAQRFEKAMDESPESDVIILLDTDVLPIAAKLRTRQLSVCEQYRKVMGVSYSAAAEWAGVDRVSNEADEWIVIDSSQQVLNKPQPEPVVPPPTPPTPPEAPEAPEGDEMDQEAQKALRSRLRGFYEAYRGLVIEALDAGHRYAKADVEALVKQHNVESKELKLKLAEDHLALISIERDNQLDKAAKIRAAKDHFNRNMKASALKAMVRGK